MKIFGVELRTYRPSDLPVLSGIDRACFSPGVAYTRHELAEFIAQPNSRTWVAEAEGNIIGFLVAELEAHQLAHIITIDVIAAWRGRGVGGIFMDAAENWAAQAGAQVVYLETAEDNHTAQSFYARRGYKKLEKVKDYYADGSAAWIMAKPLVSPSRKAPFRPP